MQVRTTDTHEHIGKTAVMLTETVAVLVVWTCMGLYGLAQDMPALVVVAAVGQGIWLQRIYCVGHEASHHKLLPEHPRANDAIGQLALFFLMVPLSVFRKIHRFHHGANRRDHQTSALDCYVVPKGAGPLRRGWAHVLWFTGILGGGWFTHSLVSILLFLFLPVSMARKVSPAFQGWNVRLQLSSWIWFLLPIALQLMLAVQVSLAVWWALCGLPLLVFSWVYSVQLYVYHYRTSVGPQTRFHARRLDQERWVSWWLLNLNHHDTHHRFTKVVWYDLPHFAEPLPPEYASNQQHRSFVRGLRDQLKGPTIVEL